MKDGSEERGSVDGAAANPARVYDVLAGGRAGLEADRAAAAALVRCCADIPRLVAANRRFLARAVTWAAGQGITQYLDLGCGFPVSPRADEAARQACPGARWAAVDSDPLAVSHMAAEVRGIPGAAVIKADLAEPGRVLEAAADTGVIDLAEPAAVVFGMVLHFFAPAEAARIVRAYAGAFPAGSCAVITVASYAGRDPGARIGRAYEAATGMRWHGYGEQDTERLFGDLALVRGKPGNVECWPMLPARPADPAVTGGIGQVVLQPRARRARPCWRLGPGRAGQSRRR